MITIVDYGMGNLGSIKNMLKKLGVESLITGDINEIKNAQKLLLPGVGSFDAAMKKLNEGYRDVLDQKVLEDKTPILGICLGMQLLTRGSEEGKMKGLGWIEADTIRFPSEKGLKVPHMGWNTVEAPEDSRLFEGIRDERFYFVHSYAVQRWDFEVGQPKMRALSAWASSWTRTESSSSTAYCE